MRRALPLLLSCAILPAGCGSAPTAATADTPGARLEAAAETAGIIPDPDASIEGSWARDTDRLCVVDTGGGASRIGVTIDYGEDQHCAASGTFRRSGGRLDVDFGKCAFKAQFDGERIVFPAELPQACESLCTGRASLDALAVDRLSGARSEAATLRSATGTLLCGD